MMTGQSRNRRRRGRRGPRPQQDAPQQEQQEVREAVEMSPVTRADGPRPEEQPVREARGPRDADGQGVANRRRARGRRRPSRRPDVGPMPTEVLKRGVRDLPPTGPIVLRQVDEITTNEGITFGCPMLTRTRIGVPWAGGQRAPRCSMGWALHNEEEASFCMRTPDLLDCWKEHPERETALRASQETENAAD